MEISLPEVVVSLFVLFLLFLLGNSLRANRSDASRHNHSALNGASVTEEDSWEGSFSEAENPKKLSLTLVIDYVDGAGTTSNRKIRVHEFDNDLHGGILIAHCHLRDAMRTFRFNRIQRCIDADSGKEITDVADYLNELYAHQIGAVS